MSSVFDHETYISPLTWRYGSAEMRRVWSEAYRRGMWRRVWVALAEAQAELGLVTAEQAADVRAHAGQVDIDRSLEIEATINHDVMAEIKAFAEQCPVGGGIIHLGATSADVEDNADALRMSEALDLVIARLRMLVECLAGQIEAHAGQACMAYTHLQPAEPTTVGYRLAQYGLDLLLDLGELKRLRAGIKGKGFKGAVGTSAATMQLLELKVRFPQRESGSRLKVGEGPANLESLTSGLARELEARAMGALGLEAFPVATQVYARKQDWLVINGLAGLAASIHKLAFDLRVLQSPMFGEWSEPFGRQQVGSSAMPFKRNPINAENMDSLARLAAGLPRVAWDNAALSLLERTLDDKANRRMLLPQAFLIADELLLRAARVVQGLVVNDGAVANNLATYGTFAATERLLMALVGAGADRQAMHELIRGHCLAAWDALQRGEPSPLVEALAADAEVLAYVSAVEVRALLDAGEYVGDAPERAREMAAQMQAAL